MAANPRKMLNQTTARGALQSTDLFPVLPLGGQTLQFGVLSDLQEFLQDQVALPTMASLRALTVLPSSHSALTLAGFYGAGDGGGGRFVYNASDTTTADDGGTIVVDAAGRRWYRLFDGPLNIRWFGMKPDLSADCKAQMLACVVAAAGRAIYVPVGEYRFDSGVAYAGIVNITGDGNGCGPGPASISNSNCTQFLLNFSMGNLFSVTTNQACYFSRFQVNVNGGDRPHTGVGISISGPIGSSNANSVISEVGFSNVDNPIALLRTTTPTVQKCYFDSWTTAGITAKTTAGVEGNGGEIANNTAYGPASASGSQGPFYYSEVGYFDFHDNLTSGGAGAVRMAATNGPCGAPLIHDNVSEDYRLYAYSIESGDGSAISMLRVHDNEISSVAFAANATAAVQVLDYNSGTAFLTDVSVRGNIIRSIHGSTSKFIDIQSGSDIIVSDNELENLGAAIGAGIRMTGTAVTGLDVTEDNQFVGSFTAKYVLGTTIVVRDVSGAFTVAQLGAWGNGSTVLTSDGQATSSTVATLIGSGSGCTGYRERGAWRAPYGLTG